MQTYRIRLELRGPLITPLHSGTIFGHLCWAWRERQGEQALVRWLAGLDQEPFLISDAFPEGWLPRPLLRPLREEEGPIPDRKALLRAESEKKLRKRPWIRMRDFLELRSALSEAALRERLRRQEDDPPALQKRRVAHNTINRLTGTTPKEGGLYFMDEEWPDGTSGRWDVYLRCALEPDWLQELFTHVGRHGYGKDASLGRGPFLAWVEAGPAELFEASGNRMMSLSHGSLTGNMEMPRYKIHVHYGKAGSLYAVSGNPFKHPMTLIRPGATFAPANAGPFGELLRGVHKDHPEIVHNAWHLAVPYTEVE